jgi:AraC-like DNA-binding protein
VSVIDKYVYAEAGISDAFGINAMIEPHSHDYYELYCFLGDEMTFFFDNMPLRLHTNDIVLVNKHVYHMTFYNGNPANQGRANISFNSGFLHKFFDLETIDGIMSLFDTPILTGGGSSAGDGLSRKIKILSAEKKPDDVFYQLSVYHNLCLLLIELLRISGEFQKTPSIEALLPEQNRISKVARYINKNYKENITLASLAQEFYVSRYFLSHSFKEATGICVTDFINKKRVNEAAFLLERTDMPLAAISGEVGFNSQAYFIKTFRAFHHTTPGKYRAEKQSLKEYCDRVSNINIQSG